MDISHIEPRLLKCGLAQEQVDKLKAAAAKLPASFADGTLMNIPRFPGLTQEESELLIARLFDHVAAELGINIEDATLLDELGLPTLEDLVSTSNWRMKVHCEERRSLV